MQRNIGIALVVVGLLGFFACDLETKKETGFIFDEEKFNTNWEKWKENDIQNYNFTLAGELLAQKYKANIIVKKGVMDSFEYDGKAPSQNDGPAPGIDDDPDAFIDDDDGPSIAGEPSILEPEFTSISDMYEKIAEMVEAEKEWWNTNTDENKISTKFDIKYDSKSNYITYFKPVSKWKAGATADTTDHAVTISKFKALSNDVVEEEEEEQEEEEEGDNEE